MQLGWHLEKHLELINLRTVLGCRDVKFNESLNSLLTGLFADAEVSRLAAGRADAAGLKAQSDRARCAPGPVLPNQLEDSACSTRPGKRR